MPCKTGTELVITMAVIYLLGYTPYRRVEKRLHLWFSGPCDPFSQQLKLEIAQTLVTTLRYNGLCQPHSNPNNPTLSMLSQLCDVTRLRVHCGGIPTNQNREKRSASLVNVELILEENAR